MCQTTSVVPFSHLVNTLFKASKSY